MQPTCTSPKNKFCIFVNNFIIYKSDYIKMGVLAFFSEQNCRQCPTAPLPIKYTGTT